jgi:thiamine biosynthesis lipoprotein
MGDAARAQRAINSAFAAVQRVHRLMSFHDPRSDVSRLNRRAWRTPLRVHPWTCAVLHEALRVASASGGLFDVTVAPRLVRWGQLPRPAGAPSPHPRAWAGDVILLPGQRVRFRRRLWIDLGGIAKGFAVDRAVDALRAAGVDAGVVNAGGDLRVFGAHDQAVHVRDPGAPGRMLPLALLRNRALATSAIYFSGRPHRGSHASAIAHPARAHPFAGTHSVSTVASRCVRADAWTKVLLLAGPAALGRARRAGVQARILHPQQSSACA